MRRVQLSVCLLLSILTYPLSAAVYQLQRPYGGNQHLLRLNIPPSVNPVQGILIYGNGAGGNSTNRATDTELVAYAESIGFAVLATGYWFNFSSSDDSELLLFETMLTEFAGMSGHPELIHAPWLPMGHSNGGQMSYGLNAKRPWKVIGFITSKGCCYNDYRPSTAALQTPGMLVAGQEDTTLRRNRIRGLFTENRLRGALWAWVEEEASGHGEMDAQQLKLTFLAECVRLRYPPDASPLEGPVVLKDLHEYDGWLVDHRSWRQGLTNIYSHADAPGEKRAYGWVPNEKIARYYQAFSTYNKASTRVSGSTGVGTAPVTLTYTPTLRSYGRRGTSSGATPTTDFYFNGRWVGQNDPNDGDRPTITVEQETGGLYAFCAIVTEPGGDQHATHLRRVFVKGPRPPSTFERWAQTHLPEDQSGPLDQLFDDGITNIKRFAFDLGTTEAFPGFESLQPADPPTETLSDVDYAVFSYRINQAAVAAGLNVMPQVASDGEPWENIVNVTDPDYENPAPILFREGDIVTFRYPFSNALETYRFRIAISDTYEGL